MPNWRKVLVSGSDASLNTLTVANGITGSLFGTASYAVTASYVNPLHQIVQITSSTTAASLLGSGSGLFTVDGTHGRIFTIDDTISGSLFSVVTGSTPILEVFSSELVVISGSLNVSNGITGSLYGTASWAISSSYALTASYVSGSSNSVSASYAISASYASTASYAFAFPDQGFGYTQSPGSTTWTIVHGLNTRIPLVDVYDSSYNQLIPAGVVSIDPNTIEITFSTAQAGYAIISKGSGINSDLAVSASYALSASYATTASYALTSPASTLQEVVNAGNGISNYGGNGSASIQLTNFTNDRTLYLNDNSYPTIRLVDNLNASNNLQIDIATLSLNGISYNWSDIVSNTSSYALTASYVQNAVSASYVSNAVSASYVQNAVSASYVLNAQTASYVLNAQTASYVLNAVSSSYALSASYAVSASYAPSSGTSISASYAATASSADSFVVRNSLTASGLFYPATDGTYASQVLQTDASGNLSFGDVSTTFDNIYNGEATTLVKGTPVYVSGSNGANPKVYRADAANASKMPVVYIVSEEITSGNVGRGVTLGHIEGINLTGYTAGTSVYVAAGGGWTSTRPTGSATIIQFLGLVTKEGNGGKGLVLNPGPVILPNIQTGYTWIGNGNSYPIAVSTSSLLVTSASYASTASYVENAQTASYILNAVSASYAISSSYALSASYAVSSSQANNSISSSYANSSSYATSASYALSASQAANATLFNSLSSSQFAQLTVNNTFTGNNIFNSVTASYLSVVSASIEYLYVIYQTSSIIYSTGSNQLGDASNDVQTLWGQVDVKSGPVTVTGSINASGGITGSLQGSASYAISSSQAYSASYAESGSYSLTSTSASYALSSSYAVSASVAGGALFAESASNAIHAETIFPYTGIASITGSLDVTNAIALGDTLSTYNIIGSSAAGGNNLFDQVTGSYTSAFFKYTVSNGANARAGELMAVWNGSTTNYTDVSTTDIGNTSEVTCSAAIAGNNIQFNITTGTSGWKIKSLATYM